jgi:hypothetical protein
MRRALLLAGLLIAEPAPASGSAAPFSGLYGGTAGAGSALSWDRLASGVNPAALGRPGASVSLAGYSPYGLAGLRTLEAGIARDAAAWGFSALYQNWIDGDRLLSAAGEARAALRRGSAGAGLSLEWSRAASGGAQAFAAGAGALWRPPLPARLLGLGAQARAESEAPFLAGFGADLAGPAGRLGGEVFRTGSAWEARYAAELRLHASLSVHAGWVPRRQTAALGVRFGAKAWEGFSAMRRHAALGGTAIQGLRWRGAEPRKEEKGGRP